MKLVCICFVFLFLSGCGVKSDVVPPQKSWFIFESSTDKKVQLKTNNDPKDVSQEKEDKKDESKAKKEIK